MYGACTRSMLVTKGSTSVRPARKRQQAHQEDTVSIADYVIDILLIAVIFRQVRPHRLTASVILLPMVLLIAAGAIYLRPPFTLGGNDLVLIVILLISGIALGVISGLGDRLWRDSRGTLMARAAALSVVAWVVGMGFRFAFAYYAYHSGGPSMARFSLHHDITGASTWTTALFLMAFGQVVARLAVVQIRRLQAHGAFGSQEPLRPSAETAR